MPAETAKKIADKVRGYINLPPRRNDPGDVPLGDGMAGKAKKDIQGRKSRLDKEIERSGG